MKRNLMFGTLVLLAGPLLAADSTPKDEVTGAAKRLADAGGYNWRTTVETTSGRFRPGPTEGKLSKDGVVYLSMTRGDNTIEAVLKGGKGAIKTPDGWTSLALASEGEPGPITFLALRLRNFKNPASEAEDLLSKAKDIKNADGVYSGDLTEEGAKQLITFRPPPGGGEGPTVSGAKGSVKFWIKDGVLSKFEYNLQGKISFDGNDMDVNRTTTTEVKNLGSTKVEVPEEAEKKLQ